MTPPRWCGGVFFCVFGEGEGVGTRARMGLGRDVRGGSIGGKREIAGGRRQGAGLPCIWGGIGVR